MKSIYITGDCHGDLLHLSRCRYDTFYRNFNEKIQKESFVIVCGDFGFIWDKRETKKEIYDLKIINEKPFTTLFVDGNHENFDRLNNDYEIVNFMGGKAHKIRDNIYHLIRGEIYTIFGYTFFTFGGAKSHDINDGIIDGDDPHWQEKSLAMDKCGMYYHRVKGISWWAEEMPNKEEMDYGLENLRKHNFKVDYIITHQPPDKVMGIVARHKNDFNELTTYLGEIDKKVEFKKWFCGHMHIDKTIDTKHRILYYDWESII